MEDAKEYTPLEMSTYMRRDEPSGNAPEFVKTELCRIDNRIIPLFSI